MRFSSGSWKWSHLGLVAAIESSQKAAINAENPRQESRISTYVHVENGYGPANAPVIGGVTGFEGNAINIGKKLQAKIQLRTQNVA